MGVETAVFIAASYYAQQQAAKAQEKAADAKNERIQQETLRQYGEMSEAESEIVSDSYKNSIQAQADYLKSRSNIELQSAASGTYGGSVDLAIEDLNTTQGQRQADILKQRDQQLGQISQGARNLQAQSNASLDRTPIKKPSILQAATEGYSMGTPITDMLGSRSKAGDAKRS